jgi:hypothetical protein
MHEAHEARPAAAPVMPGGRGRRGPRITTLRPCRALYITVCHCPCAARRALSAPPAARAGPAPAAAAPNRPRAADCGLPPPHPYSSPYHSPHCTLHAPQERHPQPPYRSPYHSPYCTLPPRGRRGQAPRRVTPQTARRELPPIPTWRSRSRRRSSSSMGPRFHAAPRPLPTTRD